MKEQQVKKLLKENNYTWDQFIEWMQGQTVGINEDGSTDYFDGDVEKFIRTGGKYRHAEEWD